MASIEYIAGFIDGEGSIQISRGRTYASGKRMYYLRLSVHQVDKRPLEALNERWPGSLLRHSTNRNPIWEWVISGITAARAIREIRPFLIGKSEQADLALEFHRLVRTKGDTRPVTDAQLVEREALYERMGDLKGTQALRASRRSEKLPN